MCPSFDVKEFALHVGSDSKVTLIALVRKSGAASMAIRSFAAAAAPAAAAPTATPTDMTHGGLKVDCVEEALIC